jgi:hypothetical protein
MRPFQGIETGSDPGRKRLRIGADFGAKPGPKTLLLMHHDRPEKPHRAGTNVEIQAFPTNYIIVAVQPHAIPAETKKKLLEQRRMLYFRLGQ